MSEPSPADDDVVDVLVVDTMRRRTALVAFAALAVSAAFVVGVVTGRDRPEIIWGHGVVVQELSADVAADPRNVELRHRLAEALVRAGALDEAERAYSAVLRLSPDDAFARMRRGALRVALADLPGGAADLEAGIAATGAAPWDAWAWLGAARLRMGDEAGAVDALEHAGALYPDDATVRLNLFAALDALERDAEAIPHLAAALELAPGLPDARALRSRLSALRRTAGLDDTPVPGVDTITLPLRRNGDLLVITALIDDVVEVELAVDTGASTTVVTPRVAAALGLDDAEALREVWFTTAGGRVALPIHPVRSLRAGDLLVTDPQIGICDACERMGIDGLIGLDILGRHVLSLDPDAATLELSPRGSPARGRPGHPHDAALLFGAWPPAP